MTPVITVSRLDFGARWSASVWGSKIVHMGRTAGDALKQALKELAELAILLLLVSCRSLPAPVLITETKGGEKMTMQEVQETGSRKDVPAGEKSSDVVSTATFSHAQGHVAKVTVTKNKWNPFATPKVYFNCIDCHTKSPEALGLTVEQPKDPWYKWPLIMLIGTGIAALVWFWGQIRAFLGPLSGALGLITRIWKKK